ncbi:phosphatidylinositol-specific phospholipase C/glycerophosphodiester phosphodiesterase family protein [Mucilaginibacter terrae]|uniref:Altered inheritance of mitochondria protein 6 n=1 Tax=Mucilaginibacter terrae TaxID=1955052 RepID=A0ABU3H0I9_9SPHI|nr:phosphatidylinositol-specific phospholipase C/glycerophosphodiester phosphodiesterase family protein [Mucilaginibacter terrae]MDT3405533.1 hypothetical protein [Mucilaginibacter terrae]
MHLRLFIIVLILINCLPGFSQSPPLVNGFAHNDYWHDRPLFDALDNGFVNMEADIYLRSNGLVVSHLPPIFGKSRTLENLYLKPLQNCINGDGAGRDCPSYPIMLMIDIKSGAEKTYKELEKLLKKYRSMLSAVEDGQFVQREITVVITGHKPYELLRKQTNRLAFIDEDLTRVHKDTLAINLYQTASCKYSSLVKWNGRGDFPEHEKQRLCHYVMLAHRFGKKVRLWASPEDPVVWNELLQCGVDLINTDKLAELKQFLNTRNMLVTSVK